MKIYHHAKTSSAAHASSSRYDVPSWTILFAGVVALLVVMPAGFAAGHEKHHREHRHHHPESQDRIVTKIPIDAAVNGATGNMRAFANGSVKPGTKRK
jgi:hypothetical protein